MLDSPLAVWVLSKACVGQSARCVDPQQGLCWPGSRSVAPVLSLTRAAVRADSFAQVADSFAQVQRRNITVVNTR